MRHGWRAVRRAGSAALIIGLLTASLSCGSGKEADAVSPPRFEASDVNRDQVNGLNDFAMRLMNRLLNDADGGNLFVSPLSVAMALSLALNGAEGETRQELLNALGDADLSLESVNGGSEVLADLLQHADPNVRMDIANGLWARQGVKMNEEYAGRLKRYFGAKADELDFNNPGSAEKINKWVRQQTQNRIDNMVSPDTLASGMAILINAVYFKGQWTKPFEAASTYDAPFHLRDGTEATVKMMRQRASFAYKTSGAYKAVRLPYGSGQWGMTIVLPDQGTAIQDVAQELLKDKGWWRDGFSDGTADVHLPRFTMRSGLEMNDPLQALGIKRAFNPTQAEFAGIADNADGMFISQVLHKSFIEVDERGTEAAAATSVVTTGSAEPPPNPFEFVADRPFLFAIADRTTGSIVFLGTVADPAHSESDSAK